MGDLCFPAGQRCLCNSHWSCFFVCFQRVVEIVNHYEIVCIPPQNRTDKVAYVKSAADKTCVRTITVTKRMKAPIYIYYELDNFYQNHCRY
ncbi:ALA-interacting subunit 1 [Linum perenne]